MSLRIAFDLDGVLADMDRELMKLASEMFGPKPGTRPDSGAPAPAADEQVPEADRESELPATLSLRQRRQLWERVQGTENFWSSLTDLEPGEVKRLGTLVESRQWEVVFLTQRPKSAGESTQLQSQRWLHRHGIRFPSVFVMTGSRGKIAAALQLDVVVDDRPENCLDVVTDSNARSILIWRGDMNLVPASARRLGIGVVASVRECLDVLEEVDVMHARPPTVLERLKRRLGLLDEG